MDFSDIRGQAPAIEALVTAIAARDRGVLLVGPPGTGATMIARRVTTLFPPLTEHERVWLAAEYEGWLGPDHQRPAIEERPFRAPHHTISSRALLGGGEHGRFPTLHRCRDMPEIVTGCPCQRALPAHRYHRQPVLPVPRAGELHLGRFGVLMLADIGEFPSAVIVGLGWKLDRMTAPPFLVATAMPCPCGWYGFTQRECSCGDASREAYSARVRKLVGKLRITTTAIAAPLFIRDMRELPPGESSAMLRARVEAMRAGRSEP